jgi:outer membrane protein assembly factor BamB
MRLGRITLLLAAVLCPAVSRGEDWPSWRGPRGDGTSLESGLPTKWSTGENIAWRIGIPGKGHSSPVVCGDRVFVTTALEDQQQRVLICLDRRDGRTLWQRTVLKSPLEKKHELNSFASATPATDGKRVWVSFFQQPNIVLACYDFNGNEMWHKSPGTFSSMHGFCSSPLLYNGLVILNCDQDAPAWIVAYDKNTGKEKWRADRPNRTRSYCTPTVIGVNGRKQLVLSGSRCVAAYDPGTGK